MIKELSAIAYIAGLLEGEGSFVRKSTGTDRNILIQCHMTDKDVLETLQTKSQVGIVLGPYYNGKEEYKDRYVWVVHGEEAYNLMKELLPHMGSRRTVTIKKLLKAYEAVPPKRIVHLSSGTIHETYDIQAWAKKRDLHPSNLYRTMTGERKQHKGWRRLS